MVTHGIVRRPGDQFSDALSRAHLVPHVGKARVQHEQYCKALRSLGVELLVLEPLHGFPDCPFVEDAAVVNERCAILANPGAPSRKGEVASIRQLLAQRYRADCLFAIEPPGTLDGGDVCRVGECYFIGLSGRTNEAGAGQLREVLERHGFAVTLIRLTALLHLKSGLAALDDHTVVVAGELGARAEIQAYRRVVLEDDDAYAANCLAVNGTVLLAAGFPRMKRAVEALGYRSLELDVSEFRKVDGGLTCLSLLLRPP